MVSPVQQDTLVFLTSWHQDSKREHSKTSSANAQVLLKPLLASPMLTFHWSKPVTWPSPVFTVGGDSEGHKYWEAWFTKGHPCYSLPHGAYLPPGEEDHAEP